MARFGQRVPEQHLAQVPVPDKYKVTAGHLIPADNQFVALSPHHKYAIVPAKGDRIVVTHVLLKPEHVAAYQHALLTKHDFPVTPFAFPTNDW